MGCYSYISCVSGEGGRTGFLPVPGLSRLMNIHEYQAKQLLAQHGVAIPPTDVCDTPDAAKAIAEQLLARARS